MKCFNPGRESNLVETEGDRDIQNQNAVYQGMRHLLQHHKTSNTALLSTAHHSSQRQGMSVCVGSLFAMYIQHNEVHNIHCMQIRREQRISRVQRNDFDRTGGRIGIPNAQSSRTITPPLHTTHSAHIPMHNACLQLQTNPTNPSITCAEPTSTFNHAWKYMRGNNVHVTLKIQQRAFS